MAPSPCVVLFWLFFGAGLTATSGDAAGGIDTARAMSSPINVGGANISFAGRVAQGSIMPQRWYSAAQADRGKAVYGQRCTQCHGDSLRGGVNEFAAPALAGPFFYENWAGKPVEDFFRYMSSMMPPEPEKLSDASYLDVMAYLLQFWNYPAGPVELSADAPAMKHTIEKIEQRQP